MTSEMCADYFANRGTLVVRTNIPATCPREERDDSPEKHAAALERTRLGLVTQKVLR